MASTVSTPTVLNRHHGFKTSPSVYGYSPESAMISLAFKTGSSSKGDENYERVRAAAKEAFFKAFGFPTPPAPDNCSFVYLERLAKGASHRLPTTRSDGEVVAAIATTRFADIPVGQSFPEKSVSEHLFSDLFDVSGNPVYRDKCGYVGSLFVASRDEDRTLTFARLLEGLVHTYNRLDLEYALCLAHKLVTRKLDQLHLPYSRLGEIDQTNGDFSRLNLPEAYKRPLERWMRLRPELVMIRRDDVAKILLGSMTPRSRMAA